MPIQWPNFDSWAPFLLDWGVRGALLVGSALVLRALLRRNSAARRHLVLASAMLALLLLPALAALLPALSLPIPMPALPTPEAAPAAQRQPSRAPAAVERAASIDTARPATAPRVPIPPATPISRVPWLLLLWGLGVSLALAPPVAGLLNVWRMTRHARPLDSADWRALSEQARSALHLSRTPRLRCSREAAMPMTWGLFRKVVLMPVGVDAWDHERRRVVLYHELAHVKRWDFATQLVARLACAVHWFNPLAWWALVAMAADRERACDDLVVGTGIEPTHYAGHLVQIVRELHRPRLATQAAVAMARTARLEARLRALLDAACSRRPLTRRMLGTAFVVAGLGAGLLAALQPAVRAEKAPTTPAGRAVELPSGVRVELYSVVRYPNGLFWTTDGALLERAPNELKGAEMNPTQNEKGYQFGLRFIGMPPPNDTPRIKVSGEKTSATARLSKGPDSASFVHLSKLDHGMRRTTLRAGMPDGEWKSHKTSESGSVALDVNSFIIGPLGLVDGTWSLSVTDDFFEQDTRLIAVGQNGSRYPCIRGDELRAHDMRVTLYTLSGIEKKDVDHFLFEYCDYEWVEFANVPLESDAHDSVKLAPTVTYTNDQIVAMLKEAGLALKKYANDAQGKVFPPRGLDGFYPDFGEGAGYVDADLEAFLKGESGVKLCYLGFAVTDEATALELVQYMAHLQELPDWSTRREKDANLGPDPQRTMLMRSVFRLREGLERFLITDINDPAAGAKAQASIPVLWELNPGPGSQNRNVLYMDGHVEEVPPNRFPITASLTWSVLDAGRRRDNPTYYEERQQARNRASCTMNLKQMGLVFKMFANEHKNYVFPELVPEPGRLAPEAAAIHPEYLTDTNILLCPGDPEPFQGPPKSIIDDHSYFYLGYALRNEADMRGFARAYRRQIVLGEGFADDLAVPAAPGQKPTSQELYRLREGVEHLLTTDEGTKAAQATIPVLVERPENHSPPGGHVLYMDGHTEFLEYPGKWPMTQVTIGILRELDGIGGQPVAHANNSAGNPGTPARAGRPDSPPGPATMLEGQVVHAGTGEAITDFEVAQQRGGDPLASGRPMGERLNYARVSDPDGVFRIEAIDEETITVVARAGGFTSSWVVLEAVPPNETVAGVMLRLHPAARIEGFVRNAAGDPISNVSVFMRSMPGDALYDTADIRSAANGTFVLNDLKPAPFDIVLSHGDYAPTKVRADPSAGTPIEAVLHKGASLRGVITCSGQVVPAWVRVNYLHDAGIALTGGGTAPDGSYSFDNLAPGPAKLSAHLIAGDNSRTSGDMIREAILEVDKDNVADFDLPNGASVVKGQVLIDGVTPKRGRVHVAVDTPEGTVECFADLRANGSYSAQKVPAGSATVTVYASRKNGRERVKSQTCTIHEAALLHQDVNLSRGGTIIGQINGAGPGHYVVLRGEVTPRALDWKTWKSLLPLTVGRGRVSPDGLFRVEGLDAGVYTVMVLSIPQPIESTGPWKTARTVSALVSVTEDAEQTVELVLPE